jgi:hypothetical protein
MKHQLYMERDVTAAFLPHQGQPLAQGLIVVMIFGHKHGFRLVALWVLSRLVAIDVDTVCHLASEYCCLLPLAA